MGSLGNRGRLVRAICLASLLAGIVSSAASAQAAPTAERAHAIGVDAYTYLYSLGPARNSVYGRAVEPQPAMAWVKRSPKRTANWALAIAHSRGGILHSFPARFKTRNSSFIAASSAGKWPLARAARRSLELSASIAFVVYNSRRTSPGKAWNGTTSAQARRQLWPMAGYLRPQVPSSKAVRAASQAVAPPAREVSLSAAA